MFFELRIYYNVIKFTITKEQILDKSAIFGGKPIIEKTDESMFRQPITTKEDEDAALDVIHTNEAEGTIMAGWYAALGIYVSEELHVISVERFCKTIREEILTVTVLQAENCAYISTISLENMPISQVILTMKY